MSIANVKFLDIPKIPDERGNISFLQNLDQIPFIIKKAYWINDIPSGTDMVGQANREFQEIVIALSGCFDVVVNDGREEKIFSLNRPDVCLYIPQMIWQPFVKFSTNSVAFIVSDQEPDNTDNFVNFSKFQITG